MGSVCKRAAPPAAAPAGPAEETWQQQQLNDDLCREALLMDLERRVDLGDQLFYAHGSRLLWRCLVDGRTAVCTVLLCPRPELLTERLSEDCEFDHKVRGSFSLGRGAGVLHLLAYLDNAAPWVEACLHRGCDLGWTDSASKLTALQLAVQRRNGSFLLAVSSMSTVRTSDVDSSPFSALSRDELQTALIAVLRHSSSHSAAAVAAAVDSLQRAGADLAAFLESSPDPCALAAACRDPFEYSRRGEFDNLLRVSWLLAKLDAAVASDSKRRTLASEPSSGSDPGDSKGGQRSLAPASLAWSDWAESSDWDSPGERLLQRHCGAALPLLVARYALSRDEIERRQLADSHYADVDDEDPFAAASLPAWCPRRPERLLARDRMLLALMAALVERGAPVHEVHWRGESLWLIAQRDWCSFDNRHQRSREQFEPLRRAVLVPLVRRLLPAACPLLPAPLCTLVCDYV